MKTPTPIHKYLKVAVPLASLLLVAPVHAAVYTYNGNGNWSAVSNWDTGIVPNAVGAVVSRTASGNYALTNDIGAVTVGTISLTGNSQFTINTGTAGNSLTLNGGGSGALIENASTAVGASLILSNSGAALNVVDNLQIKQSDANSTTSAASNRWAISINQRLVGTGNITITNVLNDLNYGSITLGGGTTSAGPYTGAVTLAQGALSWSSNAAFGNTSGITLGSTGGGDVSFVSIYTPATVGANITVAANTGGKTVLGSTVLTSPTSSISQNFNGNLLLNQNLTVISQMTNADTSGVALTGTVSGTGGLQINGTVKSSGANIDTTGIVKMSGTNTFTGDTRVYKGTLLLGAASGNKSYALQNSTLNLDAADSGTVGFGLNSSTTVNSAVLGGLSGSRDLALQNINATVAAVALSVGNNNQDTTYSGGLTGAGSLTKIGTGKLILGGSSSYTGATTITGGILQLGNGSTTGALSTSSAINNNSVLVINRSNAVAQGTDFSGAAITGTGQFTQAGIGTTTLNAINSFSGAVNVQNGVLSFNTVAANGSAQALGSGNTVNLGVASTSSGIIQYTGAAGTLAKSIYALGNGLNTVQNNGSGLLTLSGSLVKNGTVLVLNGGSGGINVTGTISGSSANSDLYVTGGTTTLSSVNTYNGPTWVYGGGILVNGITNALPTNTSLILGGTSGGTDNSSNAFDLHGYNQTVAALTSTGSGIQTVTNNGSGASLLTVTGGGTYNGIITNGNATTALTVSGGNLILGGVNTYTGATTVSGGTLSVNGSLANSAVSIASLATLNGAGTINGTADISGTASGSLTFNNAVTVRAGATASAAAFNDNITDNGTITSGLTVQRGKTLSGSGSVIGTTTVTSGTVNGSGLTLGVTTLNGLSTLSGYNIASSVAVTAGTTALTGTTKTTSALTVAVGATLSANGTIDGSALISGVIKGTSTVTGDLTLDASSTLAPAVSGATAGLTYDQIKVGGNVSLNGTLDLTSLSGLTLGATIVLIDNTGSGTTTGYFSTILTSGSTYTLSSNNDTTFTVAGTEYLLSYQASSEGDGHNNDVTLTVVPEPSTWAMIVGGVGMLGFAQRLRRRQ